MTSSPDSKSQTPNPDYCIYTDGGSRGNPGPSAGAFIILDHQKHKVAQGGQYLGSATNNVAEYQAVLLALQQLTNLSPPSPVALTFYGDSQLVARQLSGQYKIKQPHLKDLALKIHQLLQQLGARATFVSHPRAQNSQADALVNQILDAHS